MSSAGLKKDWNAIPALQASQIEIFRRGRQEPLKQLETVPRQRLLVGRTEVSYLNGQL
jgi:hypothetical protein